MYTTVTWRPECMCYVTVSYSHICLLSGFINLYDVFTFELYSMHTMWC